MPYKNPEDKKLWYKRNKERLKKERKSYFQKYYQKQAEEGNSYYQRNREEILKKRKLYRIKNREKLRQKSKEYYHKNKEKSKQRAKISAKKHLEKWRSILKETNGDIKCKECGYDKCFAALEFHHRKSREKKFQISALFRKKPTPKRVELLKEELKKCDLLCSNCHKEIHFL